MYNDVYKYSLAIILQHTQVCRDRFSKIGSANDFKDTEYGQILLDSIVTRLQAIGKKLKNILRKHNLLESNYPEIEWSKMIRFRDFISHHYEMLDYEIVYEICNSKLPQLEQALRTELDKFK
jgi:uncharacterized protein with HEPN domain